jgi:molybdopterin synthase sulfur carrier subunit
MKLRYFAWLRSQIGRTEEALTLPAEIRTVGELLVWLKGRGDGYAAALARTDLVRVAVNHDYVGPEHAVADADEVALFPPVTGG